MGSTARDRKEAERIVRKRTLLGALRVLVPLYLTYMIFLVSVFFLFIPGQKTQLRHQKKESIRQLTDSAVSLLAEYELRIQRGEIRPEQAKKEAANQIRNLRYGPQGKDYFWINDYHPFMIMHPYRPELEGTDLTLFQDEVGNYPFMAMVETVLRQGAGYVNYHWQWKDNPEREEPKISYVRGFPAWNWIVGTGIYENDIFKEIGMISRQFYQIFSGIFIFVIILSLYIARQVFKIETRKNKAETARALEELRLKKLLDLNRLSGRPTKEITQFALEEAIHLTQSQIGFLAFMNADETQLTMHSWSEQVMTECRVKEIILVYDLSATGIWAEAARTRAPVVINDYPSYESPFKKGYPEGHIEMDRLLSVPIFDGERIVALVGVGNKPFPYDESDIRQLQLMIEGMWQILQKSIKEKQLRDSEERYRILAENATDGIWIMDLPSLNFSYASPAMARMYGYDPDVFEGTEMGTHMTAESREKVRAIIRDELERDSHPGVDPDRHQNLELEIIKPDKERVWVEVKARFLRDDTGKPDRVLGITRDITERKSLEARIQQTLKMEALGTLAGGIAHDFNNILSSIIGFTELAKLKVDKDSDVQSKLDNILAGGLRARDLVKHILIFSRKADVKKSIIQIAPLVKECLKFLRASLPPDIKIRSHIDYTDGRIMADPTEVHQVLMNVFTNAAQAMKKTGGVLGVELGREEISSIDIHLTPELDPGPYIKLVISDTGTGIPKDIRGKVFEPFFTTKARGEGTGMGLSLVYGIIQEMNGRISLHSDPGQGTCFKILIPEQAERDENAGESSLPEIVKGKGKILLVDDEPSIILWTTQALMKIGYQVEGFEQGVLALERFRQAEFDLVLTDLAMPEMTGLELSEQMLSLRPDIPIVLITGFSEDLTRKEIRERGLADMIMKPILASELSQVIKRVLVGKNSPPPPSGAG